MNKTLLRSVREYKKQSVLAPFFVILEVFMEVLIPMEMAKIIDIGITEGNLGYIMQRGLILVVMAMLALWFGVVAGKMAAVAGAGYAKNLRHDIFYKVQDFSFKNIDHFLYIRSCDTNDNRYYKRADGLYDEYSYAGKSALYDSDSFLGNDPDDQCKYCAVISCGNTASGRNTDFYCEKSPFDFVKVFDDMIS